MNVKLYTDELAEQHSPKPFGVVSGINYLNVCAHCGECLKQLTMYPSKFNVVINYKDDKGDFVEWKPEEDKP